MLQGASHKTDTVLGVLPHAAERKREADKSIEADVHRQNYAASPNLDAAAVTPKLARTTTVFSGQKLAPHSAAQLNNTWQLPNKCFLGCSGRQPSKIECLRCQACPTTSVTQRYHGALACPKGNSMLDVVAGGDICCPCCCSTVVELLLVLLPQDAIGYKLLLHLTVLPGRVWIRKSSSGNVMYRFSEPKKNGTKGNERCGKQSDHPEGEAPNKAVIAAGCLLHCYLCPITRHRSLEQRNGTSVQYVSTRGWSCRCSEHCHKHPAERINCSSKKSLAVDI